MMNRTAIENLDLLAGGAVTERFGAELHAVLANILDPNTKATATRAITLKVTFRPDSTRQITALNIEAKSALAAAQPVSTTLMIGVDDDGVVTATEVGRQGQAPGQMDVDGNEFTPRAAGLTVIRG